MRVHSKDGYGCAYVGEEPFDSENIIGHGEEPIRKIQIRHSGIASQQCCHFGDEQLKGDTPLDALIGFEDG